MTKTIVPPISFKPLNLETCRSDPQWCKKEITKRLLLLLLEYTRSKPLPFMPHVEPFGPGPPRPPPQPSPDPSVYPLYSGTGDGYLRRIIQNTWPLARDNPVADDGSDTSQYRDNGICAYIHIGNYYVYRSWFDFDLSSIPSWKTISSAVLTLTGWAARDADVIIQKGTQTLPLDVNDFQAFAGPYFSNIFMTDTQCDFIFNAAGIAYLQSVLGATAYLCAREYNCDYLNVAPINYDNIMGVYFRESTTQENRPLLTITTT